MIENVVDVGDMLKGEGINASISILEKPELLNDDSSNICQKVIFIKSNIDFQQQKQCYISQQTFKA